ncbi:hypothetical protein UFVDC4_00042 [Staphylococcus phage vB_SauM-UFV_DC4]|nr:hypothetical protein UFVDC4_00042 [Staphylococcus phage vB_SauM-UFV_DC4]
MSDVYYEYKLRNKIFKFNDEIEDLSDTGIKNFITYENNILSNLLTNILIDHTVYGFIPNISYEENKNDGVDKEYVKKVNLSILKHLPLVSYSVGNSNILNDFSLNVNSVVDIYKKGNFEDEEGNKMIIPKENFKLETNINIDNLGGKIDHELFNKICGDIFDQDENFLFYKMYDHILEENSMSLYENIGNINNKLVYEIILRLNNNILSLFEKIRSHLDVRFYLRDKDFYLFSNGEIDKDSLSDEYIEISEFLGKSSLFKKITDEKIIKNYEIKENFK